MNVFFAEKNGFFYFLRKKNKIKSSFNSYFDILSVLIKSNWLLAIDLK